MKHGLKNLVRAGNCDISKNDPQLTICNKVNNLLNALK